VGDEPADVASRCRISDDACEISARHEALFLEIE
jgi:hypothetical protein